MKKRTGIIFISLLLITCISLAFTITLTKKSARYESALTKEIIREIEDRETIFYEILFDVLDKENSYQKSSSIGNHLLHMYEDTILPDELDRFYRDVLLVALNGYESESNDALREEYISVFTGSMITLDELGQVINSIAQEGQVKLDSAYTKEFREDQIDYTFIIDETSDYYQLLSEYFKEKNDKYISRLEDIKSRK